MKRDKARQKGIGAFELIEEAIQLLRSTTPAQLATYYVGTLPFVLALLYFWGDMSRSPFAGGHLVGGAIALSALFLWMKTCQAVFSQQLRALVSGESSATSAARMGRIFLNQAAIQPSGLFLLPLASIPALPLAWVFAFYQNLTVLDDGGSVDLKALMAKSRRQAMLWPGQNHVMLSVMLAFGFFVFLDLVSACFVLPALIKMFFGIESVFTRSGLSMLNSTLIVSTLGLTYICIDPILKSIYVLRCFHGESQRSGADLKAELRRLGAMRPVTAARLIILALLIVGTSGLSAATDSAQPVPVPAAVPAPASAPSAELNHAIQEVIQQPKFAWRQPRKKIIDEPSTERGFFGRIADRVKPFLKSALKAIGNAIDSLLRRLFGRQRTVQGNGAAERWILFMHVLLYALIAATAVALIWLGYRVWRGRQQAPGTIASEPLQPMPDLTDENLGADQLPEGSWMQLAQKLLAEGDLRLALRAYYLASLAQLAGKNLIHLARFKSNRDYERELRRRAHALPTLVEAFGSNLSVFDRTWYGMHEIDADDVHRFARNVEAMRGSAGVSATA